MRWLCLEDLPHGKAAYKMKTRDMDVFEQKALVEGAFAAGAYLDKVGQTDLAKLNEDQFFEVFVKFMAGYEVTMKNNFNELKETF